MLAEAGFTTIGGCFATGTCALAFGALFFAGTANETSLCAITCTGACVTDFVAGFAVAFAAGLSFAPAAAGAFTNGLPAAFTSDFPAGLFPCLSSPLDATAAVAPAVFDRAADSGAGVEEDASGAPDPGGISSTTCRSYRMSTDDNFGYTARHSGRYC